MTPFDTKVATMRRIVDAAGGRQSTKSQADDFMTASKEALGLILDHDEQAVAELVSAVKSVHDLPCLVDRFERRSVSNANGRKSAGRVIIGSGCESPAVAARTAPRQRRE